MSNPNSQLIKKPDLNDPKLRAKLAQNMGHNYYGEVAWPNDILYMFPICILGALGLIVGLSILDPAMIGEPQILSQRPWKSYLSGIYTPYSKSCVYYLTNF